MKIFFPFLAFLSLLLCVDTITAARKDAGEYWRAVMKDQPMPEALEGLVRIEAASDEKNKCNEERIKDFEQPIRSKGNEKKFKSGDGFEPRPIFWVYSDDADLKGEKSSSFAEDFNPKSILWAYGDDAN